MSISQMSWRGHLRHKGLSDPLTGHAQIQGPWGASTNILKCMQLTVCGSPLYFIAKCEVIVHTGDICPGTRDHTADSHHLALLHSDAQAALVGSV